MLPIWASNLGPQALKSVALLTVLLMLYPSSEPSARDDSDKGSHIWFH